MKEQTTELGTKIEITAEAMFQFDNDEPIKFADLFEESELTLNFNQKNSAEMIFTSETGKKFKIFIKKIKHD